MEGIEWILLKSIKPIFGLQRMYIQGNQHKRAAVRVLYNYIERDKPCEVDPHFPLLVIQGY